MAVAMAVILSASIGCSARMNPRATLVTIRFAPVQRIVCQCA